jgi:carbon monoxide dehydrogenase subunit G
MQLKNTFEVQRPLTAVWPMLLDIPVVVGCFPGASLRTQVDERTYQGTMLVKLGPILMEFDGDVVLDKVDTDACTIDFTAQWRERKGRGTARTVTHLRASSQDGVTQLDVDSDLTLAGQVAQFGRGVAVIKALSQEMMNTFASNLQVRIQEQSCAATGAAPAVPPSAPQAASAQASLSAWTLVMAALRSWLRRLGGLVVPPRRN